MIDTNGRYAKSSHLNIDNFYASDFTGIEFRTTMSARRLNILLYCVRLDVKLINLSQL